VAWQDDAAVMVQLGDSADGVRVDLASRERIAGVSPIDRGRPWELRADDGRSWPLVAVGHPEAPLSSAEIVSQGPDLVVRLAGPALSSLTDNPHAPSDPALTWVRLRQRGHDWRIVVDGLATLSIPVERPNPVRRDDGEIEVAGVTGILRLGNGVSRWSSTWEPDSGRWTFSTDPALAAVEPYGRIHVTWTPTPP
jgi:hypothetical protein